MTKLQRLEERLRVARRAADVDGRRVFTRLREEPDGVRLEVSDAQALWQLVEALRDEAGGTLHAVQLPDEDLQGTRAWVLASVADVRRHPAHGAEQITQALQGEALEPLLHEDGWLLARLPDGYVGWVRDWHVQLSDPASVCAYAERTNARIIVPWAQLREEASGRAAVCGETLFGTRVVRLSERPGWTRIELPGGRAGWVETGVVQDGVADWPCSAVSVVEMIRRFHGAPYVWGGRSPKGFDCSGLVQFVYALHGVALPRDSDQQFEHGVGVEARRAGDLLFFGGDRIGHVAVATDADAYLHARGEVRSNSLAADSPQYDAELAAIFRGTRRVLPHDL